MKVPKYITKTLSFYRIASVSININVFVLKCLIHSINNILNVFSCNYVISLVEFTQIRLRVAHQSAIYDKLIVFLIWVKKILMVFQNQGAEGEEWNLNQLTNIFLDERDAVVSETQSRANDLQDVDGICDQLLHDDLFIRQALILVASNFQNDSFMLIQVSATEGQWLRHFNIHLNEGHT